MKRFLLCILFLVLPAMAQQTVVQLLFTNATSFPTITAPISNQGQTGHFVQLQLANASGQTCSFPSVQAQLEYSFDNTNWTAFGSPQTGYQITSLKTINYSGSGLYNYVRFKLLTFNSSTCVASAWYTGTSTPAFGTVQGTFPSGTVIAAGTTLGTVQFPPVFVGGVGSTTLQPVVACDQSAFATVTAGSTSSIVNGLTSSPLGVVHVCSVVITMAATGTVQLVASALANCSSPVNLTPAFHLAANTPLALGSGLGTVINGTPSSPTISNLCAAAVTGNADVFISYAVY